MNREAIERRRNILLLGASDMDQVIAAAESIQREHRSTTQDLELIRALETAVVVCYWRPFSQSNTVGHLRESDAEDPTLHADMKKLRNQAYAHTDRSSGRTAGIKEVIASTGVEGLVFTEGWWSLPDQWLPGIVDVAIRQRDKWRAEATDLGRHLLADPE